MLFFKKRNLGDTWVFLYNHNYLFYVTYNAHTFHWIFLKYIFYITIDFNFDRLPFTTKIIDIFSMKMGHSSLRGKIKLSWIFKYHVRVRVRVRVQVHVRSK